MDRLDFEVKFAKGATEGAFEGYGAVFDNEDYGGDVIRKGAFVDTLKAWGAKGKMPKMLLQHGGGMFGGPADDAVPIGKWTAMAEDSKGLAVEGRLIALDTDRGKSVYAAMKEGELDGLSIGYRAKEFVMGTKPGEPFRTIKTADLMEVSVVLFGMNEKALVTAVKGRLGALTTKDWRELEAVLRDEDLSRADAVRAVSGFKKWLQRDAGDPEPPQRDAAGEEFLAAIRKATEAFTR